LLKLLKFKNMKPYKLVKLEGDRVITGQELYDWLIDDGFPIMDIHVISNEARPPQLVKPLYGAPREEWILYALALQKRDVECVKVAEHNKHEIELRDADIAAFATYLAMSFKIASYEQTGQSKTGQRIYEWRVTEDGLTTYIQHAGRIVDLYVKDSYSPYYEIAFGTTNGIMK